MCAHACWLHPEMPLAFTFSLSLSWCLWISRDEAVGLSRDCAAGQSRRWKPGCLDSGWNLMTVAESRCCQTPARRRDEFKQDSLRASCIPPYVPQIWRDKDPAQLIRLQESLASKNSEPVCLMDSV